MAQTRNSAQNTFEQGLVMDFAPERAGDKTLSNALNATFLTFNGNEWSLQNDMGNARVETAYLPTGYVPVGTCEFGDIIYIVSYNPIENKSQIGCFPSPERNISNKEKGGLGQSVRADNFTNTKGKIVNNSLRKIVYSNSNISPGDKYIIAWKNLEQEDKDLISNYGNESQILDNNKYYWPKLLKVHVVSIEETGKITQLDSTTKWYTDDSSQKFIISTRDLDQDTTTSNLDTYRSALSCQYSVFQSKIPGKLALYFELETIDSFSCGHKTFRRTVTDSSGKTIDVFDIYLSASWETNNYNVNPCGMLITASTFQEMQPYTDEERTNYLVTENLISEEEIYAYSRVVEFSRSYKIETPSPSYKQFLTKDSYYIRVKDYQTITSEKTATEVITTNALRVYEVDQESKVRLPKTDPETGCGMYVLNPVVYSIDSNGNYIYQTIIGESHYKCEEKSINDDIIVNYFKKSVLKYVGTVTADITDNSGDPKDCLIQYTVCPCMPYGALDSLATTNTIYFNRAETGEVKLKTWQYYVNTNSITLRFGFDTYLKTSEDEVIDKVIMEFYDNLGICACYELTDQESYDATFTEYFELDKVASNPRMSSLQIEKGGRVLKNLIPHKSENTSINYGTLVKGNYDLTQYYIINSKDEKAYLCSMNGQVLDEKSKDTLTIKDNEPAYKLNAGILYYGRPYGVRIKIFKGTQNELGGIDISGKEEPIIIDRWLWTAPLFNDRFTNTPDFKDCQLEIPLDFQATLDGSKIKIENTLFPSKTTTAEADSTFKIYRQAITGVDSEYNSISNLEIKGTPTLGDTYGNSLYLQHSALANINIKVALGEKSITFDTDTYTTDWEEEDYGDIDELHPKIIDDLEEKFDRTCLTKTPNLTTITSLKDESKNWKDQFTLEYYKCTETSENLNFNYLNASGELKSATISKYYATTGDKWSSTPLQFRLQGAKFLKSQAAKTKMLNIKHFLKKTIETKTDLEERLGISLNAGIFYHKKIAFIGLDSGDGDDCNVQFGLVDCTNYRDNTRRLVSVFATERNDTDDVSDYDFDASDSDQTKSMTKLYSAPFTPVIFGATQWNDTGAGNELNGISSSNDLSGFWGDMNAGCTEDKYQVSSGCHGVRPWDNNGSYYLGRLHQDENPRKPFNLGTSLMLKDNTSGKYIIGSDFRFYKYEQDILCQQFPWKPKVKEVTTGQSTEYIYNYAVLLASIFTQLYGVTSCLDPKDRTVYIPNNIGTCSKYEEYWNSDILVNQSVNEDFNTSSQTLDPKKSSSTLIGILPSLTLVYKNQKYQGIPLFGFAAGIAHQMYPDNKKLSELLSNDDYSEGAIELDGEEVLTFKNINPKITETTKAIAFNYSIPFSVSELRDSYVAAESATILYKINSDGTREHHIVDGFNDTSSFYTYNSDTETIAKVSSSDQFPIIKSASVNTSTGVLTYKYTNENQMVPLDSTIRIWDHIACAGGSICMKDLDQLDGYNNTFTLTMHMDDDGHFYNLRSIYLFDFNRA